MIEKIYGDKKILLYADIRELPVRRYNDMNKLIIQEAGIGNSMEDIYRHFAALADHLERENLDNAKLELQNLTFNFFAAINKINFKQRYFLGFCHKIDDHVVGDLNDDVEVNFCLQLIEDVGVTHGDIERTVDDLKKKSDLNLA